jgi:SLOG family YspA-like protein
MKLAIVGSRNYDNYDNFKVIVDQYLDKNGIPLEIISGGCKGVDKLAEKYARELDIPFKSFEADWNKYGRSAGPLRNTQIIEYCTHVLALPTKGSVGTLDTIRKAQKISKDVKIVNV